MNNILQYKGYNAGTHFGADDEVFYGQIIGISDLVSFESDSVKGLKMSFKEAVEDYVEILLHLNKVSDETNK